MTFTIADDVSSICANRLLKKYKKLKVLTMSAISHITNSQGEDYRFVIMRGDIHNPYASELYKSILILYPEVNENNRKKLSIELDKAISLAENNLPMEKQLLSKNIH